MGVTHYEAYVTDRHIDYFGANNVPWSKIDSLYKTIIKRDNLYYFKFFETYYFNIPEILKGLGVIDNTATIPFQLLSPSGDTINASIHSNSKNQNKSWKYAPQFKKLLVYSKINNYWYQYDENNKYAIGLFKFL